ncbi:GntR family transcriptional regulator/MocR family aminotransferase [Agromyces flavus]|uniref:GntR family transcriptional regulator/MocR family aminotransferase n=1 Tax=Agromyces flavus TaxID=589382 RepID=A0A1H1YPK7_9MICO|nr:PLP-dependent aminotransferase family protein [Agromyces flavus]MCP2366753.1 GntR family transcriptional regulator/MocR family aminotransferase [Agromyces flavus]GGI45301.1 GntR family transcriptional regulator [Agromyces flavus]SDT23046.1 transcriptional regulator, GntR family [Agromyces flavus]
MDGPLLVIDRDDARPLGAQLVEGLRRGILDGQLRAGDPVPSTRSLATELGVARSSVVAAYDQLAGEGYLELRQGAPTRVASFAGHSAVPAPVHSPATVTTLDAGHETGAPATTVLTGADGAGPGSGRAEPLDLRPGRPSTARLDERAWRAAWRHAGGLAVPGDTAPPFGELRLRSEIADHLRHARGVTCSPEDVVVTAGTSDAIALLASALRLALGGAPRVAVEHPGYPSARRVLERSGALRAVPVPVDADGIDLTALRGIRPAPDAVMVTPSHQYPLGGRLPVAARLSLLEWAESRGALVIEDDYDSEFRHVGAPLPALASLDRAGRTALVGSFSKVLTPWLRLGYIVLPADDAVRAAVAAVRDDETCPVPGIAQEAAAELLATGAVRRHIAAARRDYAHRRALVLAELSGIDGAPLSGLDGGLHAVIGLPAHTVADAVVARLASDGVLVAPLSDYSAIPGEGPSGLVLGYASPPDSRLAGALRLVRAAVEHELSRHPQARR